MPISQEVVQHWILDIASEVVRKLSNFVPNVRGEVLNVLEVPGAGPEDYATGVLELFDSGSIRLFSEWEDRDQGIASDRSTIVSILNQRLQLPPTLDNYLLKKGESRPPRSASVAGPDPFACTWADSYWQGDNDCLDEPVWFREWSRTHEDWRKKPWELPDWPGPSRGARAEASAKSNG